MAYFIPMNPNLHSYLTAPLPYWDSIGAAHLTAVFYQHLNDLLQSQTCTDPFTFFEITDCDAKEVIKVSYTGNVTATVYPVQLTLLFERAIGDKPYEWKENSPIIAGNEQVMTQQIVNSMLPATTPAAAPSK